MGCSALCLEMPLQTPVFKLVQIFLFLRFLIEIMEFSNFKTQRIFVYMQPDMNNFYSTFKITCDKQLFFMYAVILQQIRLPSFAWIYFRPFHQLIFNFAYQTTF